MGIVSYLSPLMLTFKHQTPCTHCVSDFRTILLQVIDAKPFDGSRRALAREIGINHAHLSRVLLGEDDDGNRYRFSPEIVGRVAKLLPEQQATALIKAYLREVAKDIAQHHGKEAVLVK